MKIGITGANTGLGAQLKLSLEQKGHTVFNFSRENGYDIESPDDRQKMMPILDECDVFINNAHVEFAQDQMFNDVFTGWKFEQKTIININDRNATSRLVNNHNASKKMLDKAAETASKTLRRCRIINVYPGQLTASTVVTDDTETMLQLSDCADSIIWCLEKPHHIEINKIKLWAFDLD